MTNDFMVFARIESFILNKNLADAMKRAKKYVKAGVDGIMIHSKSKDPNEIFKFAKAFRKLYKTIPLVSVPSTYNHVTEKNLIDNGFNIVIYANQLLRASYYSMSEVAKEILSNSRAKESEKEINFN